MGKRVEKTIERFIVQDAAGTRFEAVCKVTYELTDTLDGRTHQQDEVQRRYCLADGQHLNVNDDGSFHSVPSGKRLTRI